jgi:hypothetical protein
VRFGVAVLISAFLFGAVGTGSALATGYEGDVDYWGAFTVTIVNNQVTALQGHTGGIKCTADSQIDPVTFTLAAPVPVVNGKFHAAGMTTDDYGDTVQWSLDASVSVTRTISGSVTASGPQPALHSTTCTRTFRVAAIIPPSKAVPPLHTTFVQGPPQGGTDPSVNFDYRHGVITHLSANVGTMCGQGVMGARLYTTAYHLDPVQVNAGRFKVVADVLDEYSVVTHVILAGRIKGKKASGTIDSSRYDDVNGTLEHCTQHLRWSAHSNSASSSGGGAFFQVNPYRFGKAGSWHYYFAVKPFTCMNHVTAVLFKVSGGPSRTVSCNTTRKIGPLQPKRSYHVTATGLRTRGGKVVGRTGLGSVFDYLPGDDAAWTPAPYIP